MRERVIVCRRIAFVEGENGSGGVKTKSFEVCKYNPLTLRLKKVRLLNNNFQPADVIKIGGML